MVGSITYDFKSLTLDEVVNIIALSIYNHDYNKTKSYYICSILSPEISKSQIVISLT